MSIPVAILVRVSTDEQDNTRQVTELESVAAARGWTVTEVVREDGVSGAAKVRPKLEHVLCLAETGRIKKLLVHEVSRLSRHPAVLHNAVERCNESGVSIYWHAQQIETIMPNGDRNPAAGIMLALLGEMARTEREFLSRRVRSGLDQARRNGKHLGRPFGLCLTNEKRIAKYPEVERLLRKGTSIRHTAKITGIATATIQAVKNSIKESVLRTTTENVTAHQPHGRGKTSPEE